jgi:hypothetical protein
MVFNTDFALQVVRDHQAELLLGVSRLRIDPAEQPALRERIGAWIVRLGQAVEGRGAVHPSRALQA